MSFPPHPPSQIHAQRDPAALPVEVIERVVDFVHDDAHALASCSLTCRALLPTARKHLWSSVHIAVHSDDREPNTRRLADFLALLDANPDLAPYVRSLTWAWTSSGGSKPSWPRFKTYRLWERLPNVRALVFSRIALFATDSILELCRMFPHLEELVLNSISVVPSDVMRILTPDKTTRETRKLKRLSTSGAMSPSHVSALAEALLEQQLHASLEDLDLRCTAAVYLGAGLEPSGKAFPLLLTELAPHLRSCGVPIYAVKYSAENVGKLYDSAMQCWNLRSLKIQCDTRRVLATREPLHDNPFLFVKALADRLSRRGEPPLPHLEELSVWWLQTKQDPPGCLEAMRYLALALVGDRTRYPALKRLEIRRSAHPLWGDGEPNVYLTEEMLRNGLAIVEEANVRLVLFL